jgi:gliding motility-associated-like protein
LNATGTYPFYLQTTLGCDSTIIYNLTVYPIPPAPILSNNSPLICPGDNYVMIANPVNGGSFNWQGPNGFTSGLDSISFNAEIENMGVYSSTVTVNGCVSPSSEIELSIINIYTFDDFDFPNVFTANDDGSNDKFDLDSYFRTCQEYTLSIFNRWGNLIYQHKNNEPPFEGLTQDNKIVEDGVYMYRLDYENGIKSGFFHLIR